MDTPTISKSKYIRTVEKKKHNRFALKKSKSKADDKLVSKYVRHGEEQKEDKKVSAYLRTRETYTQGEKYLKSSVVINDEKITSKYFSTERKNFLGKLTILSIYLYICSLYVIAYTDSISWISNLLFLFMLFCTVANTFVNGTKMPMDIPNILMLAFLTYTLISSLWVVDQTDVDGSIKTTAELIVLYFIIRLNVTDLRGVRNILNAIVCGTIIMCIYTVMYYGVPYILQCIATGDRIGAEINQVNGMGMYCALLITIMFYFILYERKFGYLIFMPLAFLVQLGCGSRKGFMLVAIGIFLVAFFRAESKKVLVLLGTLIVASIVVYIVYEFAESNYFFYRITQMFAIVDSSATVTETSIGNRQKMYGLAIDLWKQNPIFGYGPKQFEYYWSLIDNGLRRPPHSTYMQILVSFGGLGFSIYYGIYLYYFKNFIQTFKYKIRYVFLFASIAVVMLFNDSGANMLNHKYSYIFLGLMASYVCAMRRLKNSGKQDEDPELYGIEEIEEDIGV